MRIQKELRPIHHEEYLLEKRSDRSNLQFKGFDGKEYPTPGALESANRAWLNETIRFKSSITGREYIDPLAMRQDEIRCLRDRIKKPY